MFGLLRRRVVEVPLAHTFDQLSIGKKFKKLGSDIVYQKTSEVQYEKLPENHFTAIKWFVVCEDFDIVEL